MLDALKFRSELVAQINGEKEDISNALERLRSAEYPSGLRINRNAGFAYAAIDIGQRLIVLGKLEEASLFFEAAENTLDVQVQQTPDTHANEKGEYLRKLALVRSNYLNKATQAKESIDLAIRLNPDNEELKRFRATLGAVNGNAFKDEAGSERGGK